MPTGPFPTDQTSLISIGAVIGTILGAVLLGLFVSSLNPTDPTVGQVDAVRRPRRLIATPRALGRAVADRDARRRHRSPTPALPGTVAFGTQLDGNRHGRRAGRDLHARPDVRLLHRDGRGVRRDAIENEIVKLADEAETVVLPRQIGPGGSGGDDVRLRHRHRRRLPGQWGPGEFEWRVYINGRRSSPGATFRFSEG